MGSDDYSAAVGGGLKLKGSKPSGVTKKKKKDKDKSKSNVEADDPRAAALHKALADEEKASAEEQLDVGKEGEEEDYDAGSNKTEAERKYEEMRRKRVCFLPPMRYPVLCLLLALLK
jgi:protein FAM32A